MLILRAAKYLSRRIFFVTNNDSPDLSMAGRTAAITRGKDLGNLGISFLPFFISGVSSFDAGIFYEVSLASLLLIFSLRLP